MSVNDNIPDAELPLWMKQAQRRVDWGILIIIGFCVVAAWSFVEQRQVTITNDAEHYAFRIADYADAFSQGIFYPRWSPHAVHGYGAPIPHFYPSGASYIGGWITYLFTNNAIATVRILYIFAVIFSGSMTYVFVKQRANALAGIVSAILYVFSPLVMRIIPYTEGDLPLVFGLALLPTMLWATQRLFKRSQAIDVAIITGTIAITILTVPIILLQSLIACSILIVICFREHRNLKLIANFGLALILGVGLTAFYWLPAILEYNDVTWFPSFIQASPYSLNLEDFFAFSQPLDGGLLIQPPVYNLGWGLLFALLVNMVTMLIWRREALFAASFFTSGVILSSILLIFATTHSTWFVLIVLCFAVSASYIAYISSVHHLVAFSASLVLIVVTILASVPTWHIPNPLSAIEETGAKAQFLHEEAGYGVAGLPYGLPLPSRLNPQVAGNLNLWDNYNETIPRLIDSQVLIPIAEETSYESQYTINSTRSRTVIYNRAYFDGWEIRNANNNFSITESNNNLIQINVPANVDANITLRMGLTTIRLFAWVVSGMVIVLIITNWRYRRHKLDVDYDTSILLPRYAIIIMTLLLILIGGIRIFAIDWFEELAIRPSRYTMESALFVRSDVDRQFQLLAYDLPQQTYQTGDTIRLTTYWAIIFPVDEYYLVRLRIVNLAENEAIYQSAYHHAGYFPTNRWQRSQPVPETYKFRIPDDTLPNEYTIFFDVYVCQEQCLASDIDTQDVTGSIRILRSLIIE